MDKLLSKHASVFWNAGVCYIVDCRTKKTVCRSLHFRRATRRARNLGYAVRVYTSYGAAPPDAIRRSEDSYVLPRAS